MSPGQSQVYSLRSCMVRKLCVGFNFHIRRLSVSLQSMLVMFAQHRLSMISKMCARSSATSFARTLTFTSLHVFRQESESECRRQILPTDSTFHPTSITRSSSTSQEP